MDSSLLLYVLTPLVLMAVAGIVFTVLEFAFGEQHQVAKHLKGVTEYEQSQMLEAEPLLVPFGRRILVPLGTGIAQWMRRLSPRGYTDRLRVRIGLAGTPSGVTVERVLVAKALIGLAAFVLVGATLLATHARLGVLIVGSAAAGVIGFAAPDIWLKQKADRRRDVIRRALPDMLDMLTISVEAGLGFDQALSKLVRNTRGPLAEEFSRVLREMQSGVSRGDAMRNMAKRTEVPELNAFIMAIIQADMLGISISSVLRSQAKEMRLKRRQIAEEIAQKAPVKMVFPLIICILPATLIVILGPAAVAIGEAFGRL